MTEKYDKSITQWNNIFSKEIPKAPTCKSIGNETLDKGIEWVCHSTKSILDFGCANGTMLFLCALNGTKYNIGIDISEKAIQSAKERSNQMTEGEYLFLQGSIDVLEKMDASSLDAIILSNILDNLYPEDVDILIREVNRLLKKSGKLLIKLNPYITAEQIVEYDIKIIKDNLLDDGLILLNYTTEEWENIFKTSFDIFNYDEIYYPKFKQTNRMFCLTKK